MVNATMSKQAVLVNTPSTYTSVSVWNKRFDLVKECELGYVDGGYLVR